MVVDVVAVVIEAENPLEPSPLLPPVSPLGVASVPQAMRVERIKAKPDE
jgi:hypothetical protein